MGNILLQLFLVGAAVALGATAGYLLHGYQIKKTSPGWLVALPALASLVIVILVIIFTNRVSEDKQGLLLDEENLSSGHMYEVTTVDVCRVWDLDTHLVRYYDHMPNVPLGIKFIAQRSPSGQIVCITPIDVNTNNQDYWDDYRKRVVESFSPQK